MGDARPNIILHLFVIRIHTQQVVSLRACVFQIEDGSLFRISEVQYLPGGRLTSEGC